MRGKRINSKRILFASSESLCGYLSLLFNGVARPAVRPLFSTMPVLGLKSKPMAKKSNMLSDLTEVEIIVMDYSVNLELYGIRVKKRYL